MEEHYSFGQRMAKTTLGVSNVDLEVEGDTANLDEKADDDVDLFLQFLEYCQETPVGELEADDAELLRGIMQEFPAVAESELGAPPEVVMESLLYRILDEWSFSSEALREESEEDDDESRNYLVVKKRAFQPVSSDFESAIGAWHRSNNADKVVRVLNILSDQRQVALHGDATENLAITEATPTLKSIEMVLRTLEESREKGLEKRAAVVVDSLSNDYGLEPNAAITGFLVKILAKSRANGAAHHAEKLLREAATKFPPGTEGGMNDVDVFNTVVTAWAKSRGSDGPKRAQELIVFMDELGAPECAPNSRTFTSLIDAYAQTQELEGVKSAEEILNNVLDLHLDGRKDLEPNVATWTIVIAAYSRICKSSKSYKRNQLEAAKRAGRLLKRMENLYEDGRLSFGPDAITYITVMNAFAFSRNKDNIEQAEQLLDEMNERYMDGDDSMKPTMRSVKILVDAWIKIGEMDRAESLYDKYEVVVNVPRTMKEDIEALYYSFLHGYCQQGEPRKAKVYLDQMLEEDIEPDTSCYDRIIDGYIKKGHSKCAVHAQEVFKIYELRREEGAIEPHERVYTSFIRALVKGRVPGLDKKADLVLKRMQKLYENGHNDAKPSTITYNVCLNACAETQHLEGTNQAEAFQTSVRLFTELRKENDPDHVTFGNLLRCANLLPSTEKKDKFVQATFQLCCEKGLLNKLVLRDLKKAASGDVWSSLTNLPADIDVQEENNIEERLPIEWSRNLPKKQDEDFSTARKRRSFANSRS
jgi:pentatricopeptide repeat protein